MLILLTLTEDKNISYHRVRDYYQGWKKMTEFLGPLVQRECISVLKISLGLIRSQLLADGSTELQAQYVNIDQKVDG